MDKEELERSLRATVLEAALAVVLWLVSQFGPEASAAVISAIQ